MYILRNKSPLQRRWWPNRPDMGKFSSVSVSTVKEGKRRLRLGRLLTHMHRMPKWLKTTGAVGHEQKSLPEPVEQETKTMKMKGILIDNQFNWSGPFSEPRPEANIYIRGKKTFSWLHGLVPTFMPQQKGFHCSPLILLQSARSLSPSDLLSRDGFFKIFLYMGLLYYFLSICCKLLQLCGNSIDQCLSVSSFWITVLISSSKLIKYLKIFLKDVTTQYFPAVIPPPTEEAHRWITLN